MITLSKDPCVLWHNTILTFEEARQKGLDPEKLRSSTLAAQILEKHNTSAHSENLAIRFDALCSHDITYVGIIQTARASGLEAFPLPYVLTNCHNSLCAVGGTINEDDHVFGLSASRKYGGIFVPPNMAVIHQYVREMLVQCGGMILGSDSHTRYGALGVMGIGEGGPELVKQLLQKTYDITRPQIICVYLEGSPSYATGPQDVALALIKAVFASGFVKNKVLEFHGPGIKNLSVEYRSGIDVMTTETTCLSSIWETDQKVEDYYAKYGRKDCYRTLQVDSAAFDGLIRIDLGKIPPMIALPFHPSNAYPIEDVIHHADDYLGAIEEEAQKQYGDLGRNLGIRKKFHDGALFVDQGIIAGCAGGSYENIALASAILQNQSTGNGSFSLSLYPSSVPVALALAETGSLTKAMLAGALVKSSFCGPCFGAGDTPANGALSIRHSTRNFPNREGSKPASGQLSLVALMDARSIAQTAANGGRLTPARDECFAIPEFSPNTSVYTKRVYFGFGHANPKEELVFGPNITDWPPMSPLPKHMLLHVASVIRDAVTTTDELIPSGETSSLRSNPLKLAEFTLSRKDPAYVGRAKDFQALEHARLAKENDAPIRYLSQIAKQVPDSVRTQLSSPHILDELGFGTTIYACKPGDGSAREQAASCQKVLGGWANLAGEYATKRYRSNLINWGMLPFVISEEDAKKISLDDDILILDIRKHVENADCEIAALCIPKKGTPTSITLHLSGLTPNERQIILDGCLINFYR